MGRWKPRGTEDEEDKGQRGGVRCLGLGVTLKSSSTAEGSCLCIKCAS